MLEGAAVWYILWVIIAIMIGVITKKGMRYYLTGSKPFMILMHGGAALWIATVFTLLNLYTPQSMTAFVQNYTAPIKAPVGGVVQTVHVSPLQHVEKGDALFTLDDEPFRIALDTAKQDKQRAVIGLANANMSVSAVKAEIEALEADVAYQSSTLFKMTQANKRAKHTYSKKVIEGQLTSTKVSTAKLRAAEVKLEQAKLAVKDAMTLLDKSDKAIEKNQWNLSHTTVYAPANGTIPNTFLQEGMTLGAARPAPYKLILDEQYVMMPVNYQGLMKIEAGNLVEFATPAYPLQVFSGKVVGVMHAGEADVMLLGTEQKTRQMMGMNYMNKQNFVKVQLTNAPKLLAGTSGMGWVSTGKQAEVHPALGFVNVIRGIIIRMKAQIYVVYSL